MRFEDKYQPRVFEDLIFEEARVKQQLRFYANNQRHKHLLLYGPPGTANQTVLNKVLEIAGKQLKEIEDAAKASDARSEQLEERAAIVDAA